MPWRNKLFELTDYEWTFYKSDSEIHAKISKRRTYSTRWLFVVSAEFSKRRVLIFELFGFFVRSFKFVICFEYILYEIKFVYISNIFCNMECNGKTTYV